MSREIDPELLENLEKLHKDLFELTATTKGIVDTVLENYLWVSQAARNLTGIDLYSHGKEASEKFFDGLTEIHCELESLINSYKE